MVVLRIRSSIERLTRARFGPDSNILTMENCSVADPGCSRIPDVVSKKIPDFGSGSASKSLSILKQKIVSKLSEYDPGCSSRIRNLIFYPSRIPDPGVKKAPDPDLMRGLNCFLGIVANHTERDNISNIKVSINNTFELAKILADIRKVRKFF
jgi:hypothetical protein